MNDRIAEIGAEFERVERLPFVCECGNQDCLRAIELSHREYESVRAHARRFAIVPDHEDPTVEIVIHENDRFGVVETFVGEASRIPELTDPRGTVGPAASRVPREASQSSTHLRFAVIEKPG